MERERESLFAGLWLPGLGPPRDLFGHHGPHGAGGGVGGVAGGGGAGGQGPMDRDLMARAKMNANDANNPFKTLNFGLNLGNLHIFITFQLNSLVKSNQFNRINSVQ